jgi:hypothetical protein
MIRTIKKLSLFALFFSAPLMALAWGLLGHRIVGEIATSYLTPKAKAEIQRILGNESLAMASNWADFIKSDSTFDSLNSWHYINLDKDLSRSEVLSFLDEDTATDVFTKINFLVAELKKKKLPLSQKKMYLRLLIHFTGDVHQPLHTGRREDQGGNRVKVTWFNNPTNLHAVWDEALVNFQQLSYTEYTAAINFTTLEQRQAWQKQPVSEWIAESYSIAEQLYTGITKPDQRLGYEYNFRYIDTLNSRLLKGGVRLAGLLNSIFV